jgi:hypothetical protein
LVGVHFEKDRRFRFSAKKNRGLRPHFLKVLKTKNTKGKRVKVPKGEFTGPTGNLN